MAAMAAMAAMMASVAGCSQPATTSGEPTESVESANEWPGEGSESTAEEDLGWTPASHPPSNDLPTIREDDIAYEYGYDGVYLDWSINLVGVDYRAIFDETGSIEIFSNDDLDNPVTRIEVPEDPDRYLGGVVFHGDVAYVGETWKRFSEGSENRTDKNLYRRIDLTTGETVDISPPDGQYWRSFAEDAVMVGDTLVKASELADGSGSCLVRIDGLEASEITCFDGKFLNSFDAATGGISVQLFNADENIIDCRERVWVSLDGSQRDLIGDDDTCYPFDGTRIEGWDIWGRNPQAPGHLRYATGRVRPVDGGEERQFGLIKSGTMHVCGQSVYWISFKPDELGRDSGHQIVMRWRPGEEHVSRVYDSRGQFSLALMPCSDGVVNLHGESDDYTHQINIYWNDSE